MGNIPNRTIEPAPFYGDIKKILGSKSKNMPEQLDGFLTKNPAANKVFIFNQAPYACSYLNKKYTFLSHENLLLTAKVAKIFIKHDLPLFVPVIKINRYHNFLDFVLGRGSLQLTQMIVPDILQKMAEQQPDLWQFEVEKLIKIHNQKNNLAKTSGGIDFLSSYLEKFKLDQFRGTLENEVLHPMKTSKINKL